MLPQRPRPLLLFDGIGAVVSASCLALVLAPFEAVFGLPARVAYSLGALAMVFAFFSLSSTASATVNHPVRLRIVGCVNLGYCALSMVLLFAHRSRLSLLGHLYLAGEIAMVAWLASYELKVARRQ